MHRCTCYVKKLQKCAVWHERKNDPEYDYDQWKAEHFDSGECEINHSKSSGAMGGCRCCSIILKVGEKKKFKGEGNKNMKIPHNVSVKSYFKKRTLLLSIV